MDKKAIFLEKSGSLGSLILNQPQKRNAISKSMWESLPNLLNEAENDDEIKVLIIRGIDGSAFAAGADISELQKIHANIESSKQYNRIVHFAEQKLNLFTKPTIAMIQGPCVGAGCGIALACDFRIADETSKFGITPANLGLVYSLYGTKLLVEKVGPSIAKDIIYSGRILNSDEAIKIRLIDKLINSEQIESETLNFCISLSEKSQFTIKSTKKIIQMILNGSTSDNEESLELFDSAFQGEDFIEGTKAFLEKRKPIFNWKK